MSAGSQLQHEVLAELEYEPTVDALAIGVTIADGIVTLNGTVKSLPEKWAAEEAALRVAGVKAVANEIDVKLVPGAERSDEDIARSAVNALACNIYVPEDRIKVKVDQGWMTLEGTVERHYEKEAADSSVRHTAGVRGVTNLIRVEPLVESTNVKERIEQALKRSAEVDAQQITVEAEGGKVVLKGNVSSWAERRQAERAAWSAPGVSAVDNRIMVKATLRPIL
ncbi:MAG TPA: BON domain-containing protein [Syntrophorhabdaceae bacterium]|nr:BON domain-containing protein [Syntrophorhabdaceae bacterium]